MTDLLKEVYRFITELLAPIAYLGAAPGVAGHTLVAPFRGRDDPALKEAWLEAMGQLAGAASALTLPANPGPIDRMEARLAKDVWDFHDKEEHVRDLLALVALVEDAGRAFVAASEGADATSNVVDWGVTYLFDLMAIGWLRDKFGGLNYAHVKGLYTLLDVLSLAAVALPKEDGTVRDGSLWNQAEALYAAFVDSVRTLDDSLEPGDPIPPDPRQVHRASRTTFLALASVYGVATKVFSELGVFRFHYGWSTEVDPELDPLESLSGRFADLLASRTLTVQLILSPDDDKFVEDIPSDIRQILTVAKAADKKFKFPPEVLEGGASSERSPVSLTFAFVPRIHGGPGLFVRPAGSLDLLFPLGALWELGVALRGSGGVIIPNLVDPDFGSESLRLALTLTRRPDAPPFSIYFSPGWRLELGGLQLAVEATPASVEFRAIAANSALIFTGKDGGLMSFLGDEEVRVAFRLGFTWDQDGYYLHGGAGLRATVPVNVDTKIGSVRAITLAIYKKDAPSEEREGAWVAEVSLGLEVRAWGLTVTLDRIGFVAFLGKGVDGSRFDPDFAGFKWPSGIGFALEWGAVSGKVYAFHDDATGTYAGIGALKLSERLSLDILGLYTPSSEDDPETLLLMLSASWASGSLGFGWTRPKRVGGLLATNRRFDTTAVRRALSQGVLQSMFFSADPKANAARVIEGLQAIFPPGDRTVLALTAQLAWGFRDAFTLDLAVLTNIDGDIADMVALIGVLRGRLPREDLQVVTLNADAIGVWDGPAKEVRIDLSLHDSKVMRAKVWGDGLLGVWWGDDEWSVLTLGGFHPSFTPPVELHRDLERFTVELVDSEFLKLKIQLYVALTHGSGQFGGRVDFFAGAGGYGVEGELGLNVLFAWNPCEVRADIHARVSLKAAGRSLLSGRLDAAIAGPDPKWFCWGEVEVSLLWWDWSIPFGDPPSDQIVLPPLDVGTGLVAAFANPENWGSAPGGTASTVVVRGRYANDAALLHPLESPTVVQREVPLEVRLDHFANHPIEGASTFSVTSVGIVGAPETTVTLTTTTESFAPPMFFELSDAEKLSRSGFEKMTAGVQLEFGGIVAGEMVFGDLDYEEIPIGVIAEDAFEPDAAPRVHDGAEILRLIASAGDLGPAPLVETDPIEALAVRVQ